MLDQITEAIRPLCSTEKGLQEAAMNIYLTSMGVRPASLPFDVESHDEAMSIYVKNPKIQSDIAAIPNIIVRTGPYFDSGDVILVINKERKDEVEPILQELEQIANDAEMSGTVRSQNPKIDILIGKMLGYICPADLGSLWNEDEVDDISFMIDGISYMGVWCSKNENTLEKANNLLEKINRALQPIGKKAILDIRTKKMKQTGGACTSGKIYRKSYTRKGKRIAGRCIRKTTRGISSRQYAQKTRRIMGIRMRGFKKTARCTRKCPARKILRSAHVRYTKRGRHIKVPAVCISDVGAHGKWIRGETGIGLLKQGNLTRYGYKNIVSMSQDIRRFALKNAISAYGPLTVWRKLNALSIYTRRTSPKTSAIVKDDMDWIKATWRLKAF